MLFRSAKATKLTIRVNCWPQGLEPKGLLGGAKYREQGAWVTWAWVKLPAGRLYWDFTASAFETKSECEDYADKRSAEDKKKADPRIDRQFYCFPAGIDPRPSKEGGP